jgi:hypothetical protein
MQNYAGDGSYPTTIPIVDDSENYQSAAPFAVGFEALADRTSALAAAIASTNTQVGKSEFPLHLVEVFGDPTISNFASSAPGRSPLAYGYKSNPATYNLFVKALLVDDVIEISASIPFISFNFPTNTWASCQQATFALVGGDTDTVVSVPCTHEWRPYELATDVCKRGLDKITVHALATIAVADTYQFQVTLTALDSWLEADGHTVTTLSNTEGVLELWRPYDGVYRIYRGMP